MESTAVIAMLLCGFAYIAWMLEYVVEDRKPALFYAAFALILLAILLSISNPG